MAHELPPDIHTLLALLQLETDDTTPQLESAPPAASENNPGFLVKAKALFAEKVNLMQQLAAEKAKVAGLEKEKGELTWKCKRLEWNLYDVREDYQKLQAELAKVTGVLEAKIHEELEENKRKNEAAQQKYQKRVKAEQEAASQLDANLARRGEAVRAQKAREEAEAAWLAREKRQAAEAARQAVQKAIAALPEADRKQVQAWQSMQFREDHKDIQRQITEWISMISTKKKTIEDIQNCILQTYRDYVPAFKELKRPEFSSSESLDIKCCIDDNYLCTIISCRDTSFYQEIVAKWPAGRLDTYRIYWAKNLDGDYILNWHKHIPS